MSWHGSFALIQVLSQNRLKCKANIPWRFYLKLLDLVQSSRLKAKPVPVLLGILDPAVILLLGYLTLLKLLLFVGLLPFVDDVSESGNAVVS